MSEIASGPEAVVLTGPTATGKTALALAVATRLPCEIVSMDSRQVYRGLEIGTAKPSPDERRRVPHHGLDLVDPGERFSAGAYARYALRVISEIRERGRVPLLVGGTGFYLRALLNPIFGEPEMEPARREALREFLATKNVADLKRWLERLDPRRFRTLAVEGGAGGRQRLSRSLELALLAGRPHSWWASGPPEETPLRALIVVLWLRREELYRRINARVDAMMRADLLEETASLVQRYGPDAPGLKTHGYMELIPVLAGVAPLKEGVEGVEAIKRDTRQYARRQITWFRHQLPRGAVFLDAARPPEKLAAAIVRLWRARCTAGIALGGPAPALSARHSSAGGT